MMHRHRNEVAFIGRSNAGKSSLLNALCEKKDLARTSKTPGRTRHAVVYDVLMALDEEKSLTLVDLPGFGFASMSKTEAEACEALIFSYIQKRKTVDLIIVLLDIRREPDKREKEIIELAKQRNIPLFLVLTKADKIALSKRKPIVDKIAEELMIKKDAIIVHSTHVKEHAKELQLMIFNKLLPIEPS